MLTISQLAGYAGVTVRAVRHYHAKGLLPEPERDRSGYRTYDAADVVLLIKIRTLADAGVPLARVGQLLVADEDEFAAAIREVDARLRREIRERQEHRRRIAQLAAGDSLALPPEVVGYLDRLRSLGTSEELIAPERDLWILTAARWPDQIGTIIADKMDQLEDPRVARLYVLLTDLAESWAADDEPSPAVDQRLEQVADTVHELLLEAEAEGRLGQPADRDFTALMDAFATDAHPGVARLQALMEERGWTGWTFTERRPEGVTGPGAVAPPPG